jgi:ornithine cyclodeaminase
MGGLGIGGSFRIVPSFFSPCQHAIAAGLVAAEAITPIGDVINGDHPGRTSNDEITLFDGTGVGLQDLAVASVAAKLAERKGKAQRIEL